MPTPVVHVNRAVAVAEVGGPLAGLALLDQMDESSVLHWHLYWSTRGELLRRAGFRDGARGGVSPFPSTARRMTAIGSSYSESWLALLRSDSQEFVWAEWLILAIAFTFV